ncbi:MAG: TIGR03936 family radical SAM-associated protein [Acidimicrobiia bacterium]|nr:TIGR03936 family radical SAM-associated protein [Acidimicrobiia bacterium]
MKIRLVYSKLGKVRFTSHRDMARVWERCLRKADIAMAYSEGFSPRPKLSFGLALPTGGESLAEYLDITLAHEWEPSDISELPRRLTASMPTGIDVLEAVALPLGVDSLQQAVTSCTWTIEMVGTTIERRSAQIAAVLDAPTLRVTRERKGKPVEDDLRPLILVLDPTEMPDGALGVLAELGTKPRAVRPSELLTALDPSLPTGRIRRLNQWITVDGARREPLAVGAAVDERTEVGAR